MIQIIILIFLAIIAVLIAFLSGLLGWIWLKLFGEGLHLSFGKKEPSTSDSEQPV